MRSRIAATAASIMVSLCPLPVFAQTAAPPPPPPRQEGTAEIAFVGTSGNVSTSTFSAGIEHIGRPTNWLIKNRILGVRGTVEGEATAESLLYNFRAERIINPRISAFGDYGFFRDRPAGITSRHDIGVGLSLKVLDSARHALAVDAGTGYLNESRRDGDNVSSATWLTGAAYKLKLSDTAEVTDDLRLLGTFDRGADWRLTHTIAVTARLTSLLSLKVSNLLRYAHLPPAGFRRTDTTTAAALVASFKRQ